MQVPVFEFTSNFCHSKASCNLLKREEKIYDKRAQLFAPTKLPTEEKTDVNLNE